MRLCLAVLLLSLAACTSIAPPPLPPNPPNAHTLETAVYPVLLLSDAHYNPILCVCKSPAQLRNRTDRDLPLLQSNATLIDAAGTRFTITDAHPVKGPRGGFMKFLVATVLPNEPFEIDFRIRPENPIRNADVWEAAHVYHDRFRHCGLSPKTPAVDLIRGFSNKNCVWPPL